MAGGELVNRGKNVQLVKSLVAPFSILFELQFACLIPLLHSREFGDLGFFSLGMQFFFLIQFA